MQYPQKRGKIVLNSIKGYAMATTKEPLPEVLLFDIDHIDTEAGFVILKPQGYNFYIVCSPYFINKLVTFAVKKSILEEINDQPNKARQNEAESSSGSP